MTGRNNFGFVFSLMERSDIRVPGNEDGELFMIDAATLEDVEAQLLAERMLGLHPMATEEFAFATVH
ncbi:hypothetical protein [Prosthecomicrobium sp. N25]|uniref:hypothetical protein n=1 Tax=Prosthecomicrobium sp. N25 TaxID=3129254 RepID=UPI003077140A